MSTQNTAHPLQGRVAVITGASSGIGEASAEKLAALGAHAVVLARRADRLTDLVARIEKNGGSATAITADVTDKSAVQAAADQVAAERGGANLLLNNAGVMLPAPIEELATDQWQRQIDLNITGLMNVIGAFVPQLVKAADKSGVADLINTSSIAAQNIFPNFAVYPALPPPARGTGPEERPRLGHRARHCRYRATGARHRPGGHRLAGGLQGGHRVADAPGHSRHDRLPRLAPAPGEPPASHHHADGPAVLNRPPRPGSRVRAAASGLDGSRAGQSYGRPASARGFRRVSEIPGRVIVCLLPARVLGRVEDEIRDGLWVRDQGDV
jgi:hypothetical protein